MKRCLIAAGLLSCAVLMMLAGTQAADDAKTAAPRASEKVAPAGTQPAIPFPAALDNAAIEEPRISDIGREALVLGNGDLNALLWESGGALRMRVTKNDIWDARIDTSEDPALLRMDIKNRKWTGGTNKPPSWHKHPYPQPRCAAVVTIGVARSEEAAWRSVRAQGSQNEWAPRESLGIMAVAGAREASAGYRHDLDTSKTVAFSALKLRLSGSPNARYFVNVTDAAGKDLVRSGWVDTPAEEKEVSFALPAGRPAAALELYVMSKDGARAENRYRLIALEGNGARQELAHGIKNDGAAIKSARLDLRRAVASVKTSQGALATVRALAGRNVFLIESPVDVSLEEIKAPQLPAARKGETGGVKWLSMSMPGDVDYKGMEYALAVASNGVRKSVSLVTSFDTKENALDAAIRLARETLATDPNALISQHERIWAQFWSASGLELSDQFFQDAWYRNLYYMRCFCRSDTAMPITLYAGLASDSTGWHGAPTLDYNIEQVFWPMFVCNQVDLMTPYVRYLDAFAPRGRWLARATYNLDGLFYPVNIFGPEHLVAPENAKSKNARQIAYVPWSYGLGLTGWALQNVWLRYKYQPDPAYLESIYPLLRDGAEFYANVLEQCQDGANGKAEIGPSYNPEHGPFGSFNNPVDIAYFRFLLDAAGEAARLLKRDAKLAERWARQRARVPDYETALLDGKPIVANWKGAAANAVPVHNVAVPAVPIFPAGQITWFSPPEQKELFERTLRWLKHNGNNSHIMVNVARARLSMPEAYTETRSHFSKIATPNGLYAAWPGHGYYLAESWAFAGLTAELLLQSVDDIIRIFPAWPKEMDAKFDSLRAQGGFLVSAAQAGGRVKSITIRSTAGGKLKFVNPWPATPQVRKNGATVIFATEGAGLFSLDTVAGDIIIFETS